MPKRKAAKKAALNKKDAQSNFQIRENELFTPQGKAPKNFAMEMKVLLLML